ncbi:MAG: LysM peptidoglycan-binding domain-containing protein [Lentisphaeria bacterium]
MKYLSFLMLIIICGCGKTERQNLTNDPFYKQGERHLANNDYVKAKVSFEKSLNLGKSYAGYLKLAEVNERSGDFEAAIFHYRKYLDFIGEANGNYPIVSAMLEHVRKEYSETFQNDILGKISPREELFKKRLTEVIVERNRLAQELKQEKNNVSENKTASKEIIETRNLSNVISTPAVDKNNAGKQVLHVVGKGDTLSAISVKYYQTSKHWRKIIEANPGHFSDSNSRLKVGQKIIIPEIK